jgi:tRNA modification GTPase
VILVINKTDLPVAVDDGRILERVRRVRISALTGLGLTLLEDVIVDLVLSGAAPTSDLPLISNPRHTTMLRRALAHLDAARDSYAKRAEAMDLLAVDLEAATNALGEITGETASEDVLSAIFGSFCVGK